MQHAGDNVARLTGSLQEQLCPVVILHPPPASFLSLALFSSSPLPDPPSSSRSPPLQPSPPPAHSRSPPPPPHQLHRRALPHRIATPAPIHGHPRAGGDGVLTGELLQLAGVFVLAVPGLWSLIKPPAPPRPRLPGPPHRRDLRAGRASRRARSRGPPATIAVRGPLREVHGHLHPHVSSRDPSPLLSRSSWRGDGDDGRRAPTLPCSRWMRVAPSFSPALLEEEVQEERFRSIEGARSASESRSSCTARSWTKGASSPAGSLRHTDV
nr:extensin [Aegilops tauschii subsp. strangulata]